MSFLRNLADQLKHLWDQTSVPARAGMAVVAALCAIAIAAVGFWSSRPQYVPIANNLTPTEAAEIVSKLDSGDIPNQLNYSGSTVLVPKSRWNKARLLLGDLAEPFPSDMPLPSESIFDDPSLNRYKLLRQQESKLARTIAQIGGIQHATVHISKPEPTPFVRDLAPTTASVVLQLRRGGVFSREQAAAIVAMMANSVEGLKPDQVTVMDTSGRILSSQGWGMDNEIANQLEYRQTIEANLASKAEMMLAEMLGRGRAVVRVSADLDFRKSERTETTFDPDSKVKKSEKIRSTAISGGATDPTGAAGTPTNIGERGGINSSKPYSEKTEENETEYETARIIDIIKEPSGTVRRLTVAAMVDLMPLDEGGAAAMATKEQVEAIIKQAVGFDLDRNDQIEVLVTKLAGTMPPDPQGDVVGTWQYVNQLLRNISLGLASLVACAIGWLVLRKLRPLSGDHGPALTVERAKHIAELSSRVLQHPEALSKVLAAWLDEHEESQDAEVPTSVEPPAIQPRRVSRAA